MNGTHTTDHEVVSDERKPAVLAELARILESPSFRGSRRCCRLLEYSVQQVLKGSTQEGLKERTIGIEVLQRSPDYDTSEDAIVRVSANEVRKRLAQYYQSVENHGDPVIALPPGSYAVTFHWQVPVIEPSVPDPVPAPTAHTNLKLVTGLCLLGLVVVGLAYWLSTRGRAAPAAGRPTAVQPALGKPDPLWSRVFNPAQKTNIVISDAVFRELQYFLGRDLTLRDYLTPGYPNTLIASARPEVKSVIAFIGRQQTTSIGSATLGSRLLAFGSKMGGVPVIRYPRHINAREFNTDNFILLGSRLSIPWGELFEPSLNFPLVTDPVNHQFYLQNRHPKPGEQAEFRESANQEETYADIAVLPNLAGTGTVLVLNGIDMVAAEAAGEFAMNGLLSAKLAAMPGPVGSRYLEILIRVKDIAGTVASIEVAAMREVAPQSPTTR